MNEQTSKISLSGVSLAFGGKTVLDDVGFDVPVGRKTVLIGPAASGKSVLMKCLAGIYKPSAGRIAINGIDPWSVSARERAEAMRAVGVVFQQGGLFDSLTVWQNITFKLRHSFGMGAAEARRSAVELLGKVNLPAATADLLPAELSGGMQKRVGIARALAGEPSVLLLDEPTAGLDPISAAAINRLIDARARETGATVLAVTSDMEAARLHYDVLAMLHRGRLIWQGAVAEIEASGDPYLLQLIHGSAEGPIEMRERARAASDAAGPRA